MNRSLNKTTRILLVVLAMASVSACTGAIGESAGSGQMGNMEMTNCSCCQAMSMQNGNGKMQMPCCTAMSDMKDMKGSMSDMSNCGCCKGMMSGKPMLCPPLEAATVPDSKAK
jgi:hypothetical protein